MSSCKLGCAERDTKTFGQSRRGAYGVNNSPIDDLPSIGGGPGTAKFVLMRRWQDLLEHFGSVNFNGGEVQARKLLGAVRLRPRKGQGSQ